MSLNSKEELMAYSVDPEIQSITRLHKIYSANRTGTCWTCAYMVNWAKDDGTGRPIAWCGAKNQIVAPERGCEYYKHISA